MPHFAYEIDSLQQGNGQKLVNVMVRDVRFDKITGKPYISLSLLNSKLQGSRQKGMTNEQEFHLLGETEQKPIKPLGAIENRLFSLGVSPYANTLPMGLDQPNPLIKFNFGKLREIQNLQWSLDALQQGDDFLNQFESQGTPKHEQNQQLLRDALDCYQRSIELDSMNKDAWAKKARLFKDQLGQLKEAEICYK